MPTFIKKYCILSVLLFSQVVFAADIPNTMTLSGTIRDFHDYGEYNTSNPDFENSAYPSSSDEPSEEVIGLVENTLDSDGKPVLKKHEKKQGDILYDYIQSANLEFYGYGLLDGSIMKKSITDQDSFSQWYRDVAGVNENMTYDITLTYDESLNAYVYDSNATPEGNTSSEKLGFFPIDGLLFGNENNSYGHNYHFTYEIQSEFTYKGGEIFAFSGDDDVWVFINDQLVIDIGGIHGRVEKRVSLDHIASEIGLEVGKTYPFAFFFAERHRSASNLKITTTLKLKDETIPDPIAEYRFDDCKYIGEIDEVNESMGSANDGIGVNIVDTSVGVLGRAALFDSDTENYIDTGKNLNGVFGTTSNAFTITAWVKPDFLNTVNSSHSAKNVFFAKADQVSNDNFVLGINPDGTLHLYLDTDANNTEMDYGSVGDITLDTWHFVALSFDAGNLTIRIDDKYYEDNSTWQGTTKIKQGTDSNFTIGTALHNPKYFDGAVDEVKIFDSALSKVQLEKLYGFESQGLDYKGLGREQPVCVISEYLFESCATDIMANLGLDSKNGNRAQVRNQNRIGITEGMVGNAMSFSGDDVDTAGYLEFETDFNLTDTFSISFWINPAEKSQSSKSMTLFSKNIDVYLDNSGKIVVDPKNGSTVVSAPVKANSNEWVNITIVYEISGGTGYITIYVIDISDKISSKTTEVGLLVDNGENLLIGTNAGADSNNFESYQGLIDEFKIFNGALIQSRIQNMYGKEKSGNSYTGEVREEVICLDPIGCIEQAIVIDDTKYVHQIDLSTGDINTTVMTDTQINDGSINGFGYNEKDGFLWGSHQGKKGYLIRMGKDADGNYAQEKVGPIDGLPTTKGTYIGDIDPNGHLYLYFKDYPVDGNNTMYVVNLDNNDSNYTNVIDSFAIDDIAISDMAFSPIDGQLYAISGGNDFFRIDIESKEIIELAQDIITVDNTTFLNQGYGSSFFDSSGFFYAVKNSDTREVVRVMFKEDENGSHIKADLFSNLINDNAADNPNIDGGRCNRYPIYIDYGDAPDSYGTYLSSDGARHKIPVSQDNLYLENIYLGNSVDSEPDAFVGDLDGDDGVVDKLRTLYTSSREYSITVSVTNELPSIGKVVAWLDFDRNGVFDSDEAVSAWVNTPSTNKNVTLTWDVPDDIQDGESYIRVRVTTDALGVDEPIGVKSNGEVEDYKIVIKEGSVYDIWEPSVGSIENSVIHTKSVNQEIVLTAASIKVDRSDFKESVYHDIKAGLFTKEGTQIHDFVDVNFTNTTDIITFSEIPSAYKEIIVTFQFTDDDNITHESNASDAFAIRPDQFFLTINPDNAPARAGQNILLHLDVADHNGNVITDYDANTSSYTLDFNETLEAAPNLCQKGDLNIVKSDIVSGVADMNATYSEVGQVNVKVFEVNGSEFAAVDRYDGSGDSRFISPADSTETITPAKIETSYTYSSKNGLDYTYYSDAMTANTGAEINIQMRMLNEAGEVVENFRPECYANTDVNSAYVYTRSGNLGGFLFSPVNAMNVDSDNNISYRALGTDFNSGEYNKTIAFNFGRDATIAKRPTRIEFGSVVSRLENDSAVNHTADINKAIDFVYAKMTTTSENKNKMGEHTIKIPFYYEVYFPDGAFGSLSGLSASLESVDWYILPLDNIAFGYSDPKMRYGSGAYISSPTKGNITIIADLIPHSNRLVYTPEEYLLYNPFNITGLTNHTASVIFNDVGQSWDGKGAKGSVFERSGSNQAKNKLDW